MSQSDWQNLFDAGKALVEKSGLARYCGQGFITCGNEAEFKRYWKKKFDPTYGRYMAWILFEVGAENLAKAACVSWGDVQVSSKPTLETYINQHFNKLGENCGLSDYDRCMLKEAFQRLKKVRNRDAHSYRKGVRSANFADVEDKFLPALNVLVKAIKDDGYPLP